MDEESRKPGASQHDAEPAALRAAAEAALPVSVPAKSERLQGRTC
jgi:hypothetical protein